MFRIDKIDDDYPKRPGSVYQQYVEEALRKYETCIRCRRKIYPTEKVDLGVAIHKNCFRCAECNVTLTLHSYIIARPENADCKGIYCKSHAPKPVIYALDDKAMEIQNAVKVQRINKRPSFNKLIRVKDLQGWQYDARAMEFDHAKFLLEQNRQGRNPRPGRPDQQSFLQDRHPDGASFTWETDTDDDVTYEDILGRLKTGALDREKVRDIAHTFGKNRKNPKDFREDIRSVNEAFEQFGLGGDINTDDDIESETCYWSRPPPSASSNSVLDVGSSSSSSSSTLSTDAIPGVVRFTSMEHRENKAHDWQCERHDSDEDSIYETLHTEVIQRSTPPRLPRRSPDQNIDKAMLAEVLLELYRAGPHRFGRSLPRQDNSGYDKEFPIYENLPRYEPPKEASKRDYFNEKSFIEQNELEKRQRHEHNQVFNDIMGTREEQVKNLEIDLRNQMEKDVQDLFFKLGQGDFKGDIEKEKQTIEQHFHRLKEEKMKGLLDQLNLHERMLMDNMIDKQSREMLQLIDKKVPVKLPSPKPPRKKKSELYDGPHVFDEVDFLAIQVAQHEQASFTELVYELTRDCKSALEKARAIFRWVTVKDLNKMIFSEEPLHEDNPFYFLKGIKYGLESYHELFKRLCSYAGLKVKTVRGVSKSVGYKPGMSFNDNRFRNSWAVVHIDGSWRFIDCHWGARHVSNNRENENFGAFCYELDEFFFMTDPDEHIYMHFPDDPEWQLLDTPLTVEEFINLPVVKSHFFAYQLVFSQHIPAEIISDNGKVELVLKKMKKIPLAFNTRLEADDEVLDGYCIHHVRDNETIFNLSLPKRGTFYFTIFACDTDKADIYNNICAVKIKCVKLVDPPFSKFPRLPHGYGLTAHGADLGLKTEKYNEFYLVCNDEKMILNVTFKEKVKVSHRVMSAMFSEHDDTLTRMSFQRYRDQQFVSNLLRFPARGIYLFSIFASCRDNMSPTLECACRYLIQVNVNPKNPLKPYPKTQPNWLKSRLYEPSSGNLRINRKVKFKIEVQDAAAVAVIVGQQWFYLQKPAGGKAWEGIAFTGRDTEVTADVYARYDSDVRDFYPLLEYKLVDED